MEIQLEKIIPNPEQPRENFPADELASLAASIKQHGIINPIAVEDAGEGFYILIDGERRMRAAKMAGLKTIPAEIRPSMNGNGKTDRLVLALVANLQRSDMSAVEEARALKRLADQGLSNSKIGHMIGKYPTYVANRLNILGLDEEIQDLVAANLLPHDVTAINALRSIQDPELRIRTARRIARPGQTIKVVESVCAKVSRAESEAHQSTSPEMKLPAVTVARRMADTKKTQRSDWQEDRKRWTMLASSGVLPPWKLVETSARATCEGCAIYDVASEKNCRDCPAVDLLRRMMEAGHAR